MKERQSNIELLRIIAMLGVVLLHANYVSLGWIGASDILSRPLESFSRMLAEQLCIVSVDIFVMISGWFGIKPSVKGIANILYQVLFYGVVLMLVGIAFGLPVPKTEMMHVFLAGGYYWFIAAYLGLYTLSPVLNLFVEKSKPGTILKVLICFFLLQCLFGWLTELGTYSGGSSLISFVGIYLLSRFVKSYSNRLKSMEVPKCLVMYLVLTLVPVLLAFVGMKYLDTTFCPLKYSSLFVIAASLFLLLAFSKFEFQSRTVNWAACSVLSVYLVHLHPMIFPLFKSFMLGAYSNLGGLMYVPFALLAALLVGIVCILMDKIRIASWNFVCKGFLDDFMNGFTKRLNGVIAKLGY